MKIKVNYVFVVFIILFVSTNFDPVYLEASAEEGIDEKTITNSLNLTKLNILIDNLTYGDHIRVDEKWSVPILISTILTIILTIILAIVIFLLQDMNIKRDILHISSIGLINEFNDHLGALDKEKSRIHYKDKEDNARYFIKEWLATGIYESIVSSGNISHFPSKLQFSIIEVYERIKYHNLIVNNINQLSDVYNPTNVYDKERFRRKALRYFESLSSYEDFLAKNLYEIKKNLETLNESTKTLKIYIKSRKKLFN